jgi:hypothetical protein
LQRQRLGADTIAYPVKSPFRYLLRATSDVRRLPMATDLHDNGTDDVSCRSSRRPPFTLACRDGCISGCIPTLDLDCSLDAQNANRDTDINLPLPYPPNARHDKRFCDVGKLPMRRGSSSQVDSRDVAQAPNADHDSSLGSFRVATPITRADKRSRHARPGSRPAFYHPS